MLITLILDALHRIQGERGEAALFHLLTGKKSAQTIQDIHTFQLESYYGLLPGIKRDAYQDELKKLILKKYVYSNNERLQLTRMGLDFLKHSADKERINDFVDINLNKSLRVFLERLHLMIQMYSNVSIGNHKFTPIIDHIPTQSWVKQYYLEHKSELTGIMEQIHGQLFSVLEKLPDPIPDIFVLRLTGINHVGWSKRQLATKYSYSVYDVDLYLLWICQKIWHQTSSTDVLYHWFPRVREGKLLTQSAQTTLEWFNQGYSMDEIANIRGFKMSTIQDHIVEMALTIQDFSLHPFITKNEFAMIQGIIKNTNSNRLRVIKENCPESISYFQIRLVLAKVKGRRG